MQACNLSLPLPPQPLLVGGTPLRLGPLGVILLQEAREAQQRLLQLQVPPLQRLLACAECHLLNIRAGRQGERGGRCSRRDVVAGRQAD